MTEAAELLQQRMERLTAVGAPEQLQFIGRGIEREGLRVNPDMGLSDRPHPPGLGAALTSPVITTDFCESQPELVTGVHRSIPALLDELRQIHAFVWRHLDDELLWPASMPCILPADGDIPLAQFGASNPGRFKHLYRVGLRHRYGAAMQTISGIHYNFSLPESFWPLWAQALSLSGPMQELRNRAMLGLMRNFNRRHWLVPYLLGASPALLAHRALPPDSRLQPLSGDTLQAKAATSLRSSQIGYTSPAQAGLAMDYNSLDGFCRQIRQAIAEPCDLWPDNFDASGERVQLGNGVLQIENELYSPLRLKCIEPGMRSHSALCAHGIRHLEVRCVDLDPREPVGLNEAGCRMLELFLLKCLLLPSPPSTAQEHQWQLANNEIVTWRGRQAQARIGDGGGRDRPLAEVIAGEALQMTQVARWLADHLPDGAKWTEAAALVRRLAANPDLTPAAVQLRQIEEQGGSFARYGGHWAKRHRRHWQNYALPQQAEDRLTAQAQASHRRHRELEQQPGKPFEQYLKDFYDQ